MPELPDVEVFRRYLDATVLGRRVQAVESVDARMLEGVSEERFRAALVGRALTETARHGKWCFARLDDRACWLALHFGMTGALSAWRTHEPEPDGDGVPAHLALRLVLDDGTRLDDRTSRRLGHVALADGVGAFAAAHDLGPDATDLDRELLDGLCARSRGGIKHLLTDQSRLAGIGNVYADEILFHARLHPEAPARDLDDGARRRLLRAVDHVLALAIERDADPERLPDGWLLPRREPGAPCPRGDGTVERITVGGRSTYLCSRCQPR